MYFSLQRKNGKEKEKKKEEETEERSAYTKRCGSGYTKSAYTKKYMRITSPFFMKTYR